MPRLGADAENADGTGTDAKALVVQIDVLYVLGLMPLKKDEEAESEMRRSRSFGLLIDALTNFD